ncbi:MAG: DNA-binding response regulator [Bacteroidetes bacterium]|nr:MAG: DNA-binding response regulator [Bacteroidota bacterium]
MMNKIKIIIVDDHRIVRQGLKSLLIGCDSIQIIASVGTAQELFDYLKQTIPDVITLDIGLPDMSGIDVLKKLSEKKIKAKAIMLSAHSSEENISNAVLAGAKGFLPKNTESKEFINAIKIVHSGGVYFGKDISDIIYQDYVTNIKEKNKNKVVLTNREIEIAKLICNGLLYKEIADRLNISVRTVESHKKNIFDKLQINSPVELVKYAIRNHIIEV